MQWRKRSGMSIDPCSLSPLVPAGAGRSLGEPPARSGSYSQTPGCGATRGDEDCSQRLLSAESATSQQHAKGSKGTIIGHKSRAFNLASVSFLVRFLSVPGLFYSRSRLPQLAGIPSQENLYVFSVTSAVRQEVSMAPRSTNRFLMSVWTCLLAGSLLLVNCVLGRVEAAKKTDAAPVVKPGDDFYGYANGEWLAHVSLPAGQHTYDNRIMMAEKTRQRVRELMQQSATAHSPAGSVAQKVGDYYASFTNEAGIEAKGFAPLTDEMGRIS